MLLQVDVLRGHAVPPAEGFLVVTDVQRSGSRLRIVGVVVVPVEDVVEHVEHQQGILHADGDHVAGFLGGLGGVGFRIAAGAHGPRHEHHVELQGDDLGLLVGIVVKVAQDPGRDGGEGDLLLTVQEAADVPAVDLGDGVHDAVGDVQVLQELQRLADFGGGQVLLGVGSDVGAVGHQQVGEVVLRPSAEAVHVDVAVAVVILGQHLAVLHELVPGPLAALDQIAGILQVRVLDHLQVEGQGLGVGDHVLLLVGDQQ